MFIILTDDKHPGFITDQTESTIEEWLNLMLCLVDEKFCCDTFCFALI